MTDAIYDAGVMLRESAARHGINLAVLVADIGLWASPEVHRFLVAENGTGAFFPHVRRHRRGDGERPNTWVNGLLLDDNRRARESLLRALGLSKKQADGFEACHIWPLTCYDPQYHTAIANLVFLPRPLASLSDHDPSVQSALQYRAFELYAWRPADQPTPAKPDHYPTQWEAPLAYTPRVQRSLTQRRYAQIAP